MKTHEILGITEEQYEDKIFKHWFKWCEINSSDDSEFQSLIANAPLNKWWLVNLQRIEVEFQEECYPYLSDCQSLREEMGDLWFKNILKMYIYYSKPLLQTKKMTIYGITN